MPDEKPISFSGLLSSTLTDSKRLFRFILLVALILFLLILFFWTGISILFSSLQKRGFKSLEISGSSIKLEIPTKKNEFQYLILVHPHGLVKTDIEVTPGDKLTFSASGSINLNLKGIIDAIAMNDSIETRILKQNPNIILPETQFKISDIKAIIDMEHSWIGPRGEIDTLFRLKTPKTKEREKLRVRPDANWGALLAGISESRLTSIMPDTFFIVGNYKEISVNVPGDLSFIVNDYLNVPNEHIRNSALYRYMYFYNNLGYFWVHIVHKKK